MQIYLGVHPQRKHAILHFLSCWDIHSELVIFIVTIITPDQKVELVVDVGVGEEDVHHKYIVKMQTLIV